MLEPPPPAALRSWLRLLLPALLLASLLGCAGLPDKVERTNTKAQPAAQAMDDVRRLAHVLAAGGEHDVRVPEEDLLGRRDDRLEARAAEPVHGDRRRLDREPRTERHVPRTVHRVARGLHRVADDRVVDLPPIMVEEAATPLR